MVTDETALEFYQAAESFREVMLKEPANSLPLKMIGTSSLPANPRCTARDNNDREKESPAFTCIQLFIIDQGVMVAA